MNSSAYEIAALAMRFWFAALMVYLVFRTVSAVLRDYGRQKRFKKAEVSAVGVLEVIEPRCDEKGKPHPLYGRRFPLRKENRIGSARSADIRIKAAGVEPVQASVFQKGNRIMLADFGGRRGVYLNGVRVGKETVPLTDGDEMIIGNAVLVLHMYGAAHEPVREYDLSVQEEEPVIPMPAHGPVEMESFCDDLFADDPSLKKKKRRGRR